MPRRRETFDTLSPRLATLPDEQVISLLDEAEPITTGTGGAAWRVWIDGVAVFVKRLILTDLEDRPEHHRDTANLFDLPIACQYRLGPPGFGTWRELAVHELTTDWVLTDKHSRFPLTYHWRRLPIPTSDDRRTTDEILQWIDTPQIRNRLTAMKAADHGIVVFSEHIPHTAASWLDSLDSDDLTAAYLKLEHDLQDLAAFMIDQGLIHFDVHFDNLLTDGTDTYLADYGLAHSADFDLSEQERHFHHTRRHYDHHGGLTVLVNTIIAHHCDGDVKDHVAQAAKTGNPPPGLPPAAADVVRRHAATAASINTYHRVAQAGEFTTPYPIPRLPLPTPHRSTTANESETEPPQAPRH